jgi:hypothetical protein
MADAEGESRSRMVKVLGIGTSVVLLFGYALNFAYDFWPSIKPDPGERLSASVSSILVDPYVRLDDFLKRADDAAYRDAVLTQFAKVELGTSSPTEEQLVCQKRRAEDYLGLVVWARVHVEGLKHREVKLSATLYDGKTHRRYQQGVELPVPSVIPHRLSSPTDDFVEGVFVDRPPADHTAVARLELRSDDGTLLDIANTKPFDSFLVRGGRTPAAC